MIGMQTKSVSPPDRAAQGSGDELVGWVAVEIDAGRAFQNHACVEARTIGGLILSRQGVRADEHCAEDADRTSITLTVQDCSESPADANLSAHGFFKVPPNKLGKMLVAWCIPNDLAQDVMRAAEADDVPAPKLIPLAVQASLRGGIGIKEPAGHQDGLIRYITVEEDLTGPCEIPVAVLHNWPLDAVAELWMSQIAERRMFPVFGETWFDVCIPGMNAATLCLSKFCPWMDGDTAEKVTYRT